MQNDFFRSVMFRWCTVIDGSVTAICNQLLKLRCTVGDNLSISDVTTFVIVTRLSSSNVVGRKTVAKIGRAMNSGIATGNGDNDVTSLGGICRAVGADGRLVATPIMTSPSAAQNSRHAVRRNTCVVKLDGCKYTISNDVIYFI